MAESEGMTEAEVREHLAEGEALAKSLYEQFGETYYGHDLGDWDSERVRPEQWRWYQKAEAVKGALVQEMA